jgi:hypothetical protein
VDADHIGVKNVDLFMVASDFFTLDVADFTGKAAAPGEIASFVEKRRKYIGSVSIPGMSRRVEVTRARLEGIAAKYLLAVREAGRIYRRIEERRGAGTFVVEVSMDETDQPQTPDEMLFILSAIAEEGIPAQTIAPKFTGRFNKGVDYVGDVGRFAREFEEDVRVVSFAVREFGLPESLKLSVHSGSDKFSLYPVINGVLRKTGAGLHLKTAGTTWLEEVAGLALSGGAGLEIAREVYSKATDRYDELCAPYAPVLDIKRDKLPSPGEVRRWDGKRFAEALQHDERNPHYDPNLRQLVHVAYKIAAEMGSRYLEALDANPGVVGRLVTDNLLNRHILPVFGGCA